MVAASLGNYFRWTLFFDVDFLFGSIAVWLMLCLYGTRWSITAAALASVWTYVLWHHPYSIPTFVGEALFVGLLFRRYRQNLVLLDGIYWLLIGMPMVWLLYTYVLQVEPSQVNIITLKQPINGIFNSLIASLLLIHVPFHRWVGRPNALRTLALRQTIFNWLVAFVFFPTLVLMLLNSHNIIHDLRTDMQLELSNLTDHTTIELQAWQQQHAQANRELARLAAQTDWDQLQVLEPYIDWTKRQLQDLHAIYVLDLNGQMVVLDENQPGSLAPDSNQNGSQDISERLGAIAPTVTSPTVWTTYTETSTNIAIARIFFREPIVKDGQLLGSIVSELDTRSLETFLQVYARSQQGKLTLVDQQRQTIVSNQPGYVAGRLFPQLTSGIRYFIEPDTYQWLPQGGRPVMRRWNQSIFVQEQTMAPQLPWRIVAEISANQRVSRVQRLHTYTWAILLGIASVALLLATLISRRLVQPLAQLATVTTNLPDRLLLQEHIRWPNSQVTELASLINNAQLMAATLTQKFQEIQQAKDTLEQRIQERTKALIEINQELTSEVIERQLIENALRVSEERFRQMAETVNEVFWMSLPDHSEILYVSPAYEEIWGYSCDSLYQDPRSFLQAVHPDDYARVAATVENQTAKDFSIEYRIVTSNGSVRWIWERSFVVRQETGQVYRIVGVAQDITDLKQVEATLQYQAEREQSLGAIAHRIRQSLNLAEIFNTTVAEVRQFLQADQVVLFRTQADGSGKLVAESDNQICTPLSNGCSPDVWWQEFTAAFQQGQLEPVADVQTDRLMSARLRDALQQAQIQAILTVPIVQGQHLLGMLSAQHCTGPRPWLPHDVNLLGQLATQVAIAIQQSELYQQAQQINTELEQQVTKRTAQLALALEYEATLKRITDNVRDTLNEEHILQTAVSELGQSLGVGSVDAALYNLEQCTTTILYEYISADLPPGQGKVADMARLNELYHHHLLKGQEVQFCFLPEYRGKIRETSQRRALLACPMVNDQGILGDLWLSKSAEDGFSPMEIRLVQQVANQCAIAIRQARLHQASLAQVEVLERLNQVKDEFLSTVSHELRTPVSNMKMAIHMLGIMIRQYADALSNVGSIQVDPGKANRYLNILEQECEREISLINDLLDLQRLDAGAQPLTLEPISLNTWLPTIITPFQERAHKRQQTLHLDILANLPQVSTDPAGLERILAELLNNACKYTPPGEHIWISLHDTSTHTQISVTNSGIEIAADELERIFDKFYRVPSTDPWKQGGTGLGLSLIKRLAEHMGGHITVESADMQTSFVLHLPLSPPSPPVLALSPDET